MRRKALIFSVLALTPAAALAAPSPTSVTITADPLVVTYGSAAKLSGVVSPAKSVKLQISAQSCVAGQAQSSPATVTSTAQGTWAQTVSPASKTVYEAKAKSAQSPALTVQVRPSLTLAKVAAHKFRTRLSAAQSFGGKIALFQKRTAGGWKTVKSVVLVQLGSGSGTVASGKTFRSGIHAGRTVRILLTQRQAGSCYAAGTSNSISS
jgi:hypothetical protein